MPSRLGGFDILGLLGHGGSGVVYSARWGHREVALKVLHPALVATDKERDRFFAEAQLLAGITHPSVVKVLNVGGLPDGRPYLAMELLRGETLAARLGRGPMPLPAALEIFYQIASAVDALHERGLVHRDLKPENVMLVGDGEFAILLDFGIAKDLAAPDSTITQDGGVRGTPAYMAPERFFGQSASVSTDIYELSVVLYAMLAGRLPWGDCADPEARLNPLPPSAHGISLPGTLEVDLLRALSTRAQNRPDTVRELWARVQSQSAGVASVAPRKRRTADVQVPTPRVTAPSPSAPHPAPAPAVGSAPHLAPARAPTPPPAPGGGVQYATTESLRGHYQHPATHSATATANIGQRRRWPWIVVGVVSTLTVLLVIGVLVGKDGDDTKDSASDDDTGESRRGASDDGDTEPSAERRSALDGPGRTRLENDLADLASALREPSRSAPSPSPLDASALTAYAGAVAMHPADTTFLVGVQIRALSDSDVFHEMLSAWSDRGAELGPLFEIAALCDLDFRTDVDWLTAGMTPRGSDDLDFDIVMSGAWTRTRLGDCLDTAAADPRVGARVQQSGRFTEITSDGVTMRLAWADERTFLFSTRDGIDGEWLAARLDGRGSLAESGPVSALLPKLDRAATAWFAGDAGPLLDEPLMKDAPRENAVFGDVAVGSDFAFALGFRYSNDVDATAALAAVDKEIAELSDEDPTMEALIGKISGQRRGSDVIVDGHLTSFATSLLGASLVGYFQAAQ